MEQRDDGMKRSLGRDCGGCTRRPRRWGIGVIGIVVRKKCVGRILSKIAKLKSVRCMYRTSHADYILCDVTSSDVDQVTSLHIGVVTPTPHEIGDLASTLLGQIP